MGDTCLRRGGGGGGRPPPHHPFPQGRRSPHRRPRLPHPPARHEHRPLRRFPTPRYLLEERAQDYVQVGRVHCGRAGPIRENHIQGSEECCALYFCYLTVLVRLYHLQVQEGYIGT